MARTTRHKQIGRNGEILAGRYVEEKGYKIVERNVHCANSEIDLVCWDPKYKEYVFVEVKTRTTPVYGDIYDTLSKEKFTRMVRGVQEYLFTKVSRGKSLPGFRIDAILITLDLQQKPTIEYLENLGWEDFED